VTLVCCVVLTLATLQATVGLFNLGEVSLELLVGGVEVAFQLVGQVVLTLNA
jgi:hypothetical protein